ncbi:7-cyano-7-deazaguanine synthase [Mesorhizobium sp. M0030]|uniref:7-cyano-7-deazaguanine synthase n=1 Tax=Mesorhizobium sp. M0030 TaxID=2956851 RepID=UPI00333CFD4D
MEKAVCLASGGLDSLVCLKLLADEGVEAMPLLINYGQRAYQRESENLLAVCKKLQLPKPHIMDISGFGLTIRSGLTDPDLDVKDDAFTPNRNLLFLICASAYAYLNGASSVVIGFLSARTTIFPDQTDEFLLAAREAIRQSLGRPIEIRTPLRSFSKNQVLELGRKIGILSYYSCHAGTEHPCGRCIACLEYGG